MQWCASIIRRCMDIVPSSALQVDIYVTNFKPTFFGLPVRPPPSFRLSVSHLASNSAIDEQLEQPQPDFARGGMGHHRSGSSSSIDSHESRESDVDLGYFTGEYTDGDPTPETLSRTHEANILELTNFQGEQDFAFPDEKNLSMNVKREGRLRRFRSRQMGMDQGGRPGPTVNLRPLHGPPLGRTHRYSALSARSTDGLLPMDPLPDHRQSIMSESHEVFSLVEREPQTWSKPSPGFIVPSDYSTVKLVTPSTTAKDGLSMSGEVSMGWNNKSEVGRSRSPPLSVVTQKPSDMPGFDVREQEAQDVDVVSEYVRPGKPKLDKMILDEVEQSRGSVVVACECVLLSLESQGGVGVDRVGFF